MDMMSVLSQRVQSSKPKQVVHSTKIGAQLVQTIRVNNIGICMVSVVCLIKGYVIDTVLIS